MRRARCSDQRGQWTVHAVPVAGRGRDRGATSDIAHRHMRPPRPPRPRGPRGFRFTDIIDLHRSCRVARVERDE